MKQTAMQHAGSALRLMLLALLAVAATAARAAPQWTHWDRLWHTPDQRGQAYLNAGDAATAARTFADRRRKAYAEAQAGQYAAAARDYAGLDDADALYNRGNALAHAGALQQALQAYDAALKLNPHDRAARRNRDLVAQALKQQQQQPQQSSQQGSQQEPQHGPQSGSPQGKQHGPQQQQQGAGPAGQQPGQQQHQQQPGQGSAPGTGASAPTPTSAASAASTAASAAQARRDAAAHLGQPGMTGQTAGHATSSAATSPPTDMATDTQAAQTPPRTEQQLAEQQWLRRIPDDPGGLLRRKFLIQHLMRQEAHK